MQATSPSIAFATIGVIKRARPDGSHDIPNVTEILEWTPVLPGGARTAGNDLATFTRPPEGIAEACAMDIKARKNGPYLVSGDLSDLRLVDFDGNPYDLTGKTNIALCRCGGSITKPFCDGTHSRTGFEAAESAVRAAEGAESAVAPEL